MPDSACLKQAWEVYNMNTTTSLILALGLAAAGASTKVIPSKHERICNEAATKTGEFQKSFFIMCMGGSDAIVWMFLED